MPRQSGGSLRRVSNGVRLTSHFEATVGYQVIRRLVLDVERVGDAPVCEEFRGRHLPSRAIDAGTVTTNRAKAF